MLPGGQGQWILTPRLVPRFSALHHAALNGNTELISLLLEAQAAVDIKDNKGKPLGAGHGPLPLCRLWVYWHAGGRSQPGHTQACGPCTMRLGKARKSP